MKTLELNSAGMFPTGLPDGELMFENPLDRPEGYWVESQTITIKIRFISMRKIISKTQYPERMDIWWILGFQGVQIGFQTSVHHRVKK